MPTVAQTFDVLGVELDVDQLVDIVKHGMSAGVSGFIYSSELYDIFTEHGEDVMAELDVRADEMGCQSGLQLVIDEITKGETDVYYSVQETKEKAIWMYVEMIAYDLLSEINHPITR
jgi:hypothetical protein|tara:strand:- start:821 stop:1171 length:351 start_codon:yes stop_codon:yes gene_type:complete